MKIIIGLILCGVLISSGTLNSSILDTTPLSISHKIQKNGFKIPGSMPLNIKEEEIVFPISLNIPKIQVHTSIIPIGLTPNGDMDMPEGFSNVGWYRHGTYLGNRGTAVIAGHYGILKNGTIAVFNNLSKLEKGDLLSIQDKNGTTITFIVRESRIYAQNDETLSVFFSNDGGTHLNLITCQGIWNNVSKNYANRLVIFTDKVE